MATIKRTASNPKPRPAKLRQVRRPGAKPPAKKKWMEPPTHRMQTGAVGWSGAVPGDLVVAKVDLYSKMDRSKHVDGDHILTAESYDYRRAVILTLAVRKGTYGIFIGRIFVKGSVVGGGKELLIPIARFHANGINFTLDDANTIERVTEGEEGEN